MSIPMSAPSLQADEPCDLFMAGLTFHHAPVAGKDAADVQEYVKAMQRAGAVVTPHHDARDARVVVGGHHRARALHRLDVLLDVRGVLTGDGRVVERQARHEPVSYTHLTLPTICSV